jgi:hypothetical protein
MINDMQMHLELSWTSLETPVLVHLHVMIIDRTPLTTDDIRIIKPRQS